MNDLADLYQEVILDHNRKPRNFGRLPAPTHQASGHNPLCGDQITVTLRLEGDRIADVAFEGAGCAISTASASLMTEALKQRNLADARALFAGFRELVTGGEPACDLDKLAVFGGVCEYPARVKCATLCWHTLQAAISGEHPEVVTTE
ncbi:MAG: SUF system NifU family Fe-S cluster assembly protein [Cyanobacteria bacterium REEB65]|nr:SUF system NifU family Fe-S cluster assembly protein [Cyanobacteria bacterium REEB65]